MRICVLGGTRFVGRAVLEYPAHAGHELLVVDRGQTEPDDLPAAEHVHADRDRLAREANRLRAFAPEAAVDTSAMTAGRAEAAVAALADDIPIVVVSSMDVYRAYASLLAGRHTDPVPLTRGCPAARAPLPLPRPAGPRSGLRRRPLRQAGRRERYLPRGAAILRLGFVYGEHDPQRREDFGRSGRVGGENEQMTARIWLCAVESDRLRLVAKLRKLGPRPPSATAGVAEPRAARQAAAP
jgi:nucleoside-diphosphate-sugar epimerase